MSLHPWLILFGRLGISPEEAQALLDAIIESRVRESPDIDERIFRLVVVATQTLGCAVSVDRLWREQSRHKIRYYIRQALRHLRESGRVFMEADKTPYGTVYHYRYHLMPGLLETLVAASSDDS